MNTHPPSPGDLIASLRQAALAPREKCVFVPDAIHTLIAALFARIFGHLEQLFLLWRAGTLPAPTAAQPRVRHPRAAQLRVRSTARRATARPDSIRVQPAVIHGAVPAARPVAPTVSPADAPRPVRCRRTGPNPGIPCPPGYAHFIAVS